MPILKSINTPNGVPCAYHKAVGGEFSYRDGVVVVRVGSWYNQAACDAGQGVLWSWPVSLPVAQAGNAENVMVADPASPFYEGLVEVDTTITLESLVARRWNEIKQERTARLVGNITVGGRTYQCNQAAMAGAALAAFMAQVDGTTATFAQPWVLTDNTSAELTAAETIAMGLAARNYVNGLSTATQAIRDALDALEPGSTPADIAAASAWPS
jgi:hypothetical protein